MLRWFSRPHACPRAHPVENSREELLVEPNERGGWSLRFAGEALASRVGNYATAGDAERVARANCTHVRVLSALSNNNELQPA